MSDGGRVLRRLRGLRSGAKLRAELDYWRSRRSEGDLEAGVPFYEWVFTAHFGLDRGFYRGKRLLDVGCGPRGSLEWADVALERVGVDPLADEYAALRSRPHAMTYVAARAERMPFGDGRFDVVSTFNSLDHVDDVHAALREMGRVARPGGTLLLLVDIDHEPTVNEPHRLDWSILEGLSEAWEVAERRHLERRGGNLLDNLQAGVPFDHDDPRERAGVLSARLMRKA